MYSWRDLREVFYSSAAISPADNDEIAHFSYEEKQKIYTLIHPYKQAGVIDSVTLREGSGISYLIAKNERSGYGHNVIFCLLKDQSPGKYPTYIMNFGKVQVSDSTLNFDEIIQSTRINLERVYGTVKSPVFRIV